MLLTALAILIAYLVGSIPFAYLFVRLIKGIDIRTVGSGNVGATNASRVLGFKYFVIIFILDVLKGFLPTFLLPRLLLRLNGAEAAPAWLPVLLALAAILGHNFPVFLKFKGGKGVATSLGAMFALDPIASAAAAVTFLVVLLLTRYVSMGSMLGAIAFAGVHFATTAEPFSAGNLPMSIVTILLVGMLCYRHRANLVRIGKGTEPKVPLRRKKPA